MQAEKQDARLPLVIGVTGHREIDPKNERLVAAVRGELTHIGKRHPHCPFIVLSGLAEGADRLVARLAIEVLDARLIAVLPFAEQEFRKDFKSAESQNEFTQFLNRAQAVVLAPQREVDGEVAAGGEARNRQYARAGAYIVENCQLLLAIWDGQPARGVGGTGDVVKWRLAGEVPPELTTSTEPRSVLWPKAPIRLTHINPGTGELRHPESSSEADSVLLSLESYNRELVDFARESGDSVVRGLFADALGDRTSDPLVQQDGGLQRLLAIFTVADLIAARNQRRDNKLIFVIAVLLFLAMVFSNLSTWSWSLAVYALFLLIIALVAKWATHERIEARFFDYRALAEGLRVAVFWRLAGLTRRVSQNYLNIHLGVVSWIREALMSAEMACLTTEAQDRRPSAERIALVRDLWLQDQADYFDAKITHLKRRTSLLSRYSSVAFFLSWAVAVGKLVGKGAGEGSWLENLTTQLVLLSGPLLALGIALGFYRKKRALDSVMRRYSLSRQLFDRALARLSTGNYPAESVLLQVGREALNENADWLWTQRAAPLNPRK